jgi:hypothetical protein
VFRRRSETVEDDAPEAQSPGKTEGKGRPTPKRRESEARNRQPITAPKDRKEAYRKVRERQAKDRAKTRAGAARGDDKYLPKRDQGPVKKLARDYVDSRHTIGSNFMIVMLGVLVVSMLPNAWAKLLGFFAMPLMILVVLVEGVVLSRGVKRLAAERLPDESIAGVGMYAAMRSMQMRRMRMPQVRLKPGQQDQV